MAPLPIHRVRPRTLNTASLGIGATSWQGRAGCTGELRDTFPVNRARALTLGAVGLLGSGAIGAGGRHARREWRRRLAVIDRQVAGHAAHWVDRELPDGAFHYVVLGDSAAQGVGVGDPRLGYVGHIARRLERHLGRPVHVTNLSVSGARIADVVEGQLPLLGAHRADLITAAIGGNDVVVARLNLQALRDDLETLCATLPPGTVVAEVPYFGYPFLQRRVRLINAEIHAAARRHGHHVAPLHAATRARWPQHIIGDLAEDLFHPGIRGYRVWAAAIWSAIETGGRIPPRRRG